jgi:hypothetical protein
MYLELVIYVPIAIGKQAHNERSPNLRLGLLRLNLNQLRARTVDDVIDNAVFL